MGREKRELESREEAWRQLVRKEGWRCSHCSTPPPLGDREIFFETGMCGSCANAMSKDD